MRRTRMFPNIYLPFYFLPFFPFTFYPNGKEQAGMFAHGKGAADGVGAVVKRIPDAAVAQGHDVATIEDFFEVVKENTQNINIATIDEYYIIEKDLLIPLEKLLNLKGTMKVHMAKRN
ncbi:unnamed protein product [Pieris brassicae]|uniref:Uncharacterized protein n=1 Tax=Pieris brassicae TaxID=7116 RepID=A0A9P0XH72_PIEBR|nr:unnamed protein product [Pieris brassicae]